MEEELCYKCPGYSYTKQSKIAIRKLRLHKRCIMIMRISPLGKPARSFCILTRIVLQNFVQLAEQSKNIDKP